MITAILLTILFLAELFFSVWNLKTKKQHSKEKMFFQIAFSLLLLIGLLTGILKGTSRYGMLLLLCILQTAHSFLRGYIRKERPVKVMGQILRPLGNLLLYCFALIPAILFPQYKEPQVTGSYSVTTSQYTWTDESRIETYSDTGENSSVTVKFWYPTEAGSYPLVVFSHGSTGVIDSNTSTFTELASNGYVVASIGHPYQAMMVKDVNGKVTPINMEFLNQVMNDNGEDTPEHNKAVYEMSKEWMVVRTADMNFVLDTILNKYANGEAGPFSSVNPEKIGLFGHSLGGATAVGVGRQRTDIDAIIDLEGTMLTEYTGFENDCYLFNDEPYPVPLLDVNSEAIYRQATDQISQEYVNFYVGDLESDAA